MTLKPEDWLDKWKLSYGIREKQIFRESFVPSEVTVEWNGLENCVKVINWKIYGIWMKVVVFSKHFFRKGLKQKEKKCKGGKKLTQRMAVAFFVSADGGKVDKPIVI